MKLLIIEDDNETRDYVSAGLKEAGHTVDSAKDGYEGLLLAKVTRNKYPPSLLPEFKAGFELRLLKIKWGVIFASYLKEGNYDLLIVDHRMLPLLDGLTMVKTLRGAQCHVPVLFLTTMCGIDVRVEGLNAGADDYLVKPFTFSELAARVNALLRRPRETADLKVLQVRDLELDLLKRLVRRDRQLIDLQPTEFRLLEYLVLHAGQVVTRTMLLENVWDFHFDPKTNIVETHISPAQQAECRRQAGYHPDYTRRRVYDP